MTLAVAASIIVGAAFLLAGGAKLAAGKAWPAQARALGAPAAVAPVVPWFEIVLGALLCAQIARTVAALVAVAVLLVFSALIVTQLLRGRRPPCACFGSWSARPIGWRHLLRNAVLIALALVAAFA